MNWIESIRHEFAVMKDSDIDLKKFGLTLGGIMLLLSAYAIWKQWWTIEFIMVIGIIGCIFMILGMISPRLLKYLYRVWMGIAIVLGSIVSRIILAIIFYIILTPIAILAKLFGKRFLYGFKMIKSESLWIRRDPSKTINYERMS